MATKIRITILTGAGLTVSPVFSGISTLYLTNKLRNLVIPNYEIGAKNPGEYFYQKLCYHYTRKSKGSCDLAIVNFETIIHLLEELYSHLASYNQNDIKSKSDSYLIGLARYKGVKPSFLKLKDVIKIDLVSMKVATNTDHLSEIIRTIYTYFIQGIIDELKKFNSDSSNVGMNQFISCFIKPHLPNNKYIKRFYSLNYDTWLNKHLGIYDGFDLLGNFEENKVMIQDDFDCHYNLHGSILWQNDLDRNNMKKLPKPVNYLGYRQSSNYGINREPLIPTPIITGYNKLERMKYDPYLQYYYALQKDILNSDLLLIIGYSFTDTHVNNILSLNKGKCVVVGYISEWFDNEKAAILPGQPLDYNNVLYDIFDEVGEKINSVVPNNGGFELREKEISKGWISSKNGNTKIWWKGIGSEFYKEWPNIIS